MPERAGMLAQGRDDVAVAIERDKVDLLAAAASLWAAVRVNRGQ